MKINDPEVANAMLNVNIPMKSHLRHHINIVMNINIRINSYQRRWHVERSSIRWPQWTSILIFALLTGMNITVSVSIDLLCWEYQYWADRWYWSIFIGILMSIIAISAIDNYGRYIRWDININSCSIGMSDIYQDINIPTLSIAIFIMFIYMLRIIIVSIFIVILINI